MSLPAACPQSPSRFGDGSSIGLLRTPAGSPFYLVLRAWLHPLPLSQFLSGRHSYVLIIIVTTAVLSRALDTYLCMWAGEPGTDCPAQPPHASSPRARALLRTLNSGLASRCSSQAWGNEPTKSQLLAFQEGNWNSLLGISEGSNNSC